MDPSPSSDDDRLKIQSPWATQSSWEMADDMPKHATMDDTSRNSSALVMTSYGRSSTTTQAKKYGNDDDDDNESSCSSSVDIAFATLDMSGVNFDVPMDGDDAIHGLAEAIASPAVAPAPSTNGTNGIGGVEPQPPPLQEYQPQQQQHHDQHHKSHHPHLGPDDDVHWNNRSHPDRNNHRRQEEELVSFNTCSPKSMWQQIEHDILFAHLDQDNHDDATTLHDDDNDDDDGTLHGMTRRTKNRVVTGEGGSEMTRRWSHMIQTGNYIPLLQQAKIPKPRIKTQCTTTTTTTTTTPVEWGTIDVETTTKDIGLGTALLHYCTNRPWVGNNTNMDMTMTEPEQLLQLELIGIAALNVFLQVNYTGPSLGDVAQSTLRSNDKDVAQSRPQTQNDDHTNTNNDDDKNDEIYYLDIQRPYTIETTVASGNTEEEADDTKTANDHEEQQKQQELNDRYFHNSVLAELAVDGEWPCQVCQLPYWLLVARTILNHVANYYNNNNTGALTTTTNHQQHPDDDADDPIRTTSTSRASSSAVNYDHYFPACRVWSMRAAISHARLLMGDESSTTLWKEIQSGFRHILTYYCLPVDTVATETSSLHLLSSTLSACPKLQNQAASLVLEWGLAQHFMDRPGKGRISFYQAMQYSGLQVELTGALGKRTKYQQVATAQLQVKASSRSSRQENAQEQQQQNEATQECETAVPPTSEEHETKGARHEAEQQQGILQSIAVQHSEDEILLEHVKYDDDEIESSAPLSILDQTIILALCLDVKNTNSQLRRFDRRRNGRLSRSSPAIATTTKSTFQ